MQLHFDLSFPINITNWDGKLITLVPDAEIKEQLNTLKQAGISHVMVAGLQLEEPRDFDIDEAAGRIGDLIANEGFSISSHHCLITTFGELNESQELTQEKMLKTVDFCARMNANTLVIHPGRIEGRHVTVDTIFSKFELELEKHGIDPVLNTAATNFQVMGKAAASVGLKLALENLGRFEPLADMALLPRLIDKVDMSNVGYCLDSGHAHAFGTSVVKWIEIMGDKLFTTHFHDNRAALSGIKLESMFVQATKAQDEHLSPGFGTISWMDVIHAMRKINYQYPINFEVDGWPVDDVVDSYQKAIAWWRMAETLSYERCRNS